MSSLLLAAALEREASQWERNARGVNDALAADLNLTPLEQQFFVEWEVPEPDGPHGESISGG